MNSFFASVEQAANPFLRGKPIVVGGGIEKHSVVAAASYEAKARGIKNAMSTWEAKRLCPEVIVVIGDMNKYIHTSKEITRMLVHYTDLIEVFSIDEAFLDVTDTKDRFGGEIAIAKSVKQWIREKFHLTCNIGIGPNKLMAKLAGELKKPDGLIVLRPEDIPGKIDKVKVSELCGVGQKLEIYLAEMGIRTIGELNRCPREKLVKRFGAASGEHLWHMGQGLDNSPVLPYYHEREAKSMGHAYTLPRFTTDMDEVKSYLLRLSEQIGRRLRRDHCKGNVVHASLGFGNYQFWGKQKKLEDYLDDGYEIFKVAEKLIGYGNETRIDTRLSSFGRTTNDEQRYGPRNHNRTPGIRFVGVSVSNLIHDLDQVSLLPQKEANKKVLKAVDEINDRFGEFTVERAALMGTVLRKKTGMVSSRSYGYEC
jgi:DNA polymerase-4